MLKWEIITLNNHECVVFKEAKYIVAMTTVKPKLFSVLWPNVERKRMHYTLTGIYRTEPITLNFLLGTKGVNVFYPFHLKHYCAYLLWQSIFRNTVNTNIKR